MTVVEEKAELRARSLERRKELHAAITQAGEMACDHFLDAIGFPDGAVVSAYLPVKDEFDVLPFVEVADLFGHEIGMPIVAAKAKPLKFLQWTPESELVEGAMGIPTSPADAPVVVPDLLLVPMMAFDEEGFRLGYGGGFYDRTLAHLRNRNRATLAVGVCFSGLQVDRVPHDEHDARLDWVVTERAAWKV